MKEYEESTKSAKFIDRRLGEKDDTLQEFDKAILRMQRERQVIMLDNLILFVWQDWECSYVKVVMEFFIFDCWIWSILWRLAR